WCAARTGSSHQLLGRGAALPGSRLPRPRVLQAQDLSALLAAAQSVGEDRAMSPRISERTHKTLVVSINAAGTLTAQLLALIIRRLAVTAHPIKYADATDLPVCLHKSADAHKTMNGLVDFGKSGTRL